MYLWKVDSLVEDFKSGKVTQKEELKYMLLFTIAMALASDPILSMGDSYNYYDTLNSTQTLGISILGIIYCYKINSRGDDRDFILRVMCIGLPVMVRVLAVMIPVFVAASFVEVFYIYPESVYEETVENTPIQVALVPIFMFAYYWYLSVKIKDVSSSVA